MGKEEVYKPVHLDRTYTAIVATILVGVITAPTAGVIGMPIRIAPIFPLQMVKTALVETGLSITAFHTVLVRCQEGAGRQISSDAAETEDPRPILQEGVAAAVFLAVVAVVRARFKIFY